MRRPGDDSPTARASKHWRGHAALGCRPGRRFESDPRRFRNFAGVPRGPGWVGRVGGRRKSNDGRTARDVLGRTRHGADCRRRRTGRNGGVTAHATHGVAPRALTSHGQIVVLGPVRTSRAQDFGLVRHEPRQRERGLVERSSTKTDGACFAIVVLDSRKLRQCHAGAGPRWRMASRGSRCGLFQDRRIDDGRRKELADQDW